ncbi:MAG: hypothetical protein GXO22_04775 [Aquificae bacterium]|nr:hypothetical protein [Aquificota bacterium]
MLRYKTLLLSVILLLFNLYAQEEKKLDIEYTYKKGIQYYSYNSYYDALRELQKILRFPDSHYYNKTLFMLSKVYLKIGKRTGIKKYLWSSLYYLNIYASRTKKYNWDYYMLKGNIYEAIGLYERAISVYRIASSYIKNDQQIKRTVISLLRASVGFGKMDFVTRYMIQAGTQILEEKDKKELEFIKGMVEFSNKNYQKAMKSFLKTYREFEVYLIDNPEYYYIVAETAYRLKDFEFANKLFRRISSTVKDAKIIRKSILRIADIGLQTGENSTAITNYYTLVHKYPKTEEGIIAKLKLIGIMEKDPKTKARILAFAKEEFKEPIKFIAQNLVNYRTGYIGKFALANLGQIVFESDSKKLLKRLQWEISLLYPPKLEFEHIEYLRFMWKGEIAKLSPEKTCSVYLVNPKFFQISMDKETLLKIAKDLKKCKKYTEKIQLLKFMLIKWDEDNIRLELAQGYYENQEYHQSLKILNTVKTKDCRYATLYGKNFIQLNLDLSPVVSKIEKLCPKNNLEAYAIKYIHLLHTNTEEPLRFAEKYANPLGKQYNQNETITYFINKLLTKLDLFERYNQLYTLSKKLYTHSKDLCHIGSMLIIASIRTQKTEEIENLSEKIDDCKNSWAEVAKHLYESYQITRRLKR